jgi:hypothetical protein
MFKVIVKKKWSENGEEITRLVIRVGTNNLITEEKRHGKIWKENRIDRRNPRYFQIISRFAGK